MPKDVRYTEYSRGTAGVAGVQQGYSRGCRGTNTRGFTIVQGHYVVWVFVAWLPRATFPYIPRNCPLSRSEIDPSHPLLCT